MEQEDEKNSVAREGMSGGGGGGGGLHLSRYPTIFSFHRK